MLAILVMGCIVLARSVAELWTTVPPAEWWALIALTLISGSAVLKIPAVPVNFSISDVFTLTSAVVFGPAAGTVIVAVDGLVISARLARTGLPLERILFNAAAPPLAMWLSARAYFRLSGLQPLHVQSVGLEVVGPWLLAFAGLYFLLNTFAIAIAIALHERVNVIAIWRAHFQDLWFTFIGGAVGAGLIVFTLQLGIDGTAVLSLPLLLALLLHFAYRNATGRVADQLRHLAEVNRLHLSTIEALAHAIDAKDAVTHGHIRRVQRWAVALAARVGVDDEQQIRAIEAAALLHDIGKLAVPEHILNKPGKLTPAEFERMKAHARVGAEILSEVDFPYPVVPIVRHHHENWDGTGYPDGIGGDRIPIGARILSVVDCFDALTSDRPYRRALSADDAFAIIDARRGTMYDPGVVEAFRDLRATLLADGEAAGDGAAQAAAPAAGSPDDRPDGAAAAHWRAALELGAALSRASGDPNPWRTLVNAVRRLPDCDTVVLFVVDEAAQRLTPAAATGTHAREIAELTMAPGERMSGWVAVTGQPMVTADAALDLFDVRAAALRSGLAVPYDAPDGRRAVLAAYSLREHAFSVFHQQLLAAAMSFVAAADTPSRPRTTGDPYGPPRVRRHVLALEPVRAGN